MPVGDLYGVQAEVSAMRIRVAEVTLGDGIAEYRVVAENNVQARDLVVTHLASSGTPYKSIRVRDTPEDDDGPARVLL